MDEAVEHSIIAWVNTFSDLSQPCSRLADLADGVILYEILCQLLPGQVEQAGGGIKYDVRDNWVLKSTNVKRLLKILEEIFSNNTNVQATFSSDIDVAAVTKTEDPEEIFKVAQLVLACVVHSAESGKFIGQIMGLDSEHQQHIMFAMKEVMEKLQNHDGESERPHESAAHAMSDVDSSELKQELQSAKADRTALQEKVDKLTHDLQEWKHEVDEWKSKYSLLQGEKDTLNRRLLESESAAARNENENEHAELHSQLEEKDREIFDLRRKVEDLGRYKEENRGLHDEIDLLREKAVEAEKLEASLAKYKRRVDELSDIKEQKKAMEDENSRLLEKIMDLEEEVKKIAVLNQQCEKYKKELKDVRKENIDLGNAKAIKEKEAARAVEAADKATKEASSQRAEIESLHTRIAQLEEERANQDMNQSGPHSDSTSFVEVITPELKEKIARLEREARKNHESSEKLLLLETQLTDMTEEKEDYERNYKEASQKILELESQIESLQQQATSGSEAGAKVRQLEADRASLKAKLAEAEENAKGLQSELEEKTENLQSELNASKKMRDSAQSKVKSLEEERAQLRHEIETLKVQSDSMRTDATTLSAEIQKRVKDLDAENANLRNALEAERKRVQSVQALPSQVVPMATGDDLSAGSYQNMISEKDKEISLLQAQVKSLNGKFEKANEDFLRKWNEARQATQMEQRMMITAFYDCCMELTKLRSRLGVTQPEQPKSWIKQKRTQLK